MKIIIVIETIIIFILLFLLLKFDYSKNLEGSSPPFESKSKIKADDIKLDKSHLPESLPEKKFELFAVRKIERIEKFIPLDSKQKDRLKDKFISEANGKAAASLEDILGLEQAKEYQMQINKAIADSEQVNREREIYWYRRKLNISDQQEQSLFKLLENINNQANQVILAKNYKSRMEYVIKRYQFMQDLFNAGMKDILNEEQFSEFLKLKQDTPEANLELWH